MNLSHNFTLDMLTRSETAKRKSIPNMPGPLELERLKALCNTILEPLLQRYGAKMIVTSGYRSTELNRAIGGAKSSQHMKGEAADVVVAGVTPLTVCRWIEKNLRFDQLIHEYGDWTHVSTATKPRKEMLTCYKKAGKTVYVPGLIEIPKE